jgi:hypothetical protein
MVVHEPFAHGVKIDKNAVNIQRDLFFGEALHQSSEEVASRKLDVFTHRYLPLLTPFAERDTLFAYGRRAIRERIERS